MAIPLPALDIRPPQQQEGPLDQVGRLLQLKNMLAQQKMLPLEMQQREQAVEAGGLQNQRTQLELDQSRALMDSAKGVDWSQNDAFDKFLTGAQSSGKVNPQVLSAMALQRAQYKEQLEKTDSATLANDKTRTNMFLGHIDAIKQGADPKIQAQQVLDADLVKDPNMVQQLKAIAAGQVTPSADQLTMLENGLIDHSTQIENALKAAQTKEAGAKATEAAAGTQKTLLEMGTGEAGYRNLLAKMARGEQLSDDELSRAVAFEASQAKTSTQSDTLGVTSTSTSRPSGLAALRGRLAAATGGAPSNTGAQGGAPSATSPEGIRQNMVDLIGQYKVDPATLSRLQFKHPEIMGLVRQKYPDWDATDYNAKNKMVQSFTSGPESKSINAISTALGHAGELGNAIEALGNSDGMNMLRKVGNAVGVNITGNDKVTAFNTIVHRLGPEITAAYVQGGGGEGERLANAKDFDASLGNQQLRTNLGETVKLLRSKIAAQEQQWSTTYRPSRPEDNFSTRFLTPQAKETLGKWSPESGGQSGASPQGRPVYVKGKLVGYTTDGKTMTPASQ